MSYQVQHMIEDRGTPISVVRNDPITKALAIMVEHDYSQLPVIKDEHGFDVPEGMITYEGILRGIRNFKAKIEDLKVRDVMSAAPVYSLEDDLFDIFDKLKDTNAVLVKDVDTPALVGIITSYDATEYFRDRTEDLMRIEDIESIVKDFIQAAYKSQDGELDRDKLYVTISQVTAYRRTGNQNNKQLEFEDLSLGDYINVLIYKETWKFVGPILDVPRNFISELLNGIRQIRNALAHFRGDITAEQRDKLKFGAEWLSRCQEQYQFKVEEEERKKLVELFKKKDSELKPTMIREDPGSYKASTQIRESSTDFSVTEAATKGGRYALLADWLQSQPGRVDRVQLTFAQIEEIIGSDLPPSARNRRVWWANDSVGHSQSQQWLEAGWRSTYINMSEEKVTFARIREREKAYIEFFSLLLDELRKYPDFPLKDVSPDGVSWLVVQTVPKTGGSNGSFTFSFSRDRRLRVELYLDLGDKEQTKAVFDKLMDHKAELGQELRDIEWERLNNRRASRIALYHDGHILEEENHDVLRKWAADTMFHFYDALADRADTAIREVKKE